MMQVWVEIMKILGNFRGTTLFNRARYSTSLPPRILRRTPLIMNLSSGQGLGKRRREKMGISRKPVLIGLAIVMGLGFVVYFRLWIIDYRISADDTELLRRQFDLAHREAADESAEWRSRFDEEMERATECMRALNELKESCGKIAKDMPSVDERVERLQKENTELHEKLESLKQELETVKLKSKSQ